MKSIIKAAFRPFANRHYSNKKSSVIMYAAQYVPILLFVTYGAIFVNAIFWIVVAGIILIGFVDYLAFDAFLDKLSWKLLWRHFYSEEAQPRTVEQDLMKRYEENPTSENYEALQKHLKN